MRRHNLKFSVAVPAFWAFGVLAGGLGSSDARAQSSTTLEEISVFGAGQGRASSQDPRGPVAGYRATRSTTATKTDTPIIETPQAVSVVTRDLIEDRQVQSVTEALTTVPGFAPAQQQSFYFTDNYTLRGFIVGANDTGAIYRDGRRTVNTLRYDPELLERIEVIKGPASVLFGAAEPGGLINLVSKRAIPGASFGFLKQEVGSFSHFKTVADLNTPIGDGAALRLPFSYRNYGSFIDFVDGDSFNFAPSLTVDIGPQTRVSLLNNFVRLGQIDNSVGVPIRGDGQILDLPRSRFLGRPGLRSTASLAQTTLEVEHRFTPDLVLTSSYSYYDVSQRLRDTGALFVFPDNRTVFRFFDYTPQNDSGHMTEHDLVWNTSLLGMEHKLLFGLDAFWRDNNRTSQTGVGTPIDAFNPVYNNTVGPPSLIDVRSKSSGFQLGLYAQDQVTVLRDLPGVYKLILMGGGRYDMASQEQLQTGTTFGAPSNTFGTRDDTAFSPRAGIVYMPVPVLSLYGSYTTSFKPQLATLLGGGTSPPTEGLQYEAGIKYEVLPSVFLTSAVFDITKTNILTASAVPGFSVVTGEVRSKGAEFGVEGQILPGWQLAASYTTLDTRITKDAVNTGNRLLGAPSDTIGLFTSYTILEGEYAGVGGGFGLTHVGDMFNQNSNLTRVPAYTTYDASVWYRPRMDGPLRPEYQLTVKNIGNEKYYLGGAAGGINVVQVGAPRTLLASVRIRF